MILSAIERSSAENFSGGPSRLEYKMESFSRTSPAGDLKESKSRPAEFFSLVKMELGVVRTAGRSEGLELGGREVGRSTNCFRPAAHC